MGLSTLSRYATFLEMEPPKNVNVLYNEKNASCCVLLKKKKKKKKKRKEKKEEDEKGTRKVGGMSEISEISEKHTKSATQKHSYQNKQNKT